MELPGLASKLFFSTRGGACSSGQILVLSGGFRFGLLRALLTGTAFECGWAWVR